MQPEMCYTWFPGTCTSHFTNLVVWSTAHISEMMVRLHIMLMVAYTPAILYAGCTEIPQSRGWNRNQSESRHDWQTYVLMSLQSQMTSSEKTTLLDVIDDIMGIATLMNSLCATAPRAGEQIHGNLATPCGQIGRSRRLQLSVEDVSFTIAFYAGFDLNITFVQFQLAFSAGDCHSESLAIDGRLYCGWRLPWTVYITGKQSTVQTNTTLVFYSMVQSRSNFALLYSVYERGSVVENVKHGSHRTMETYKTWRYEWGHVKLTVHTLNIRVAGLESHTRVTYIKAPTVYQIRVGRPSWASTCDLHIFDGPSTRSARMDKNMSKSTAFLVTFTMNTAPSECKDKSIGFTKVVTSHTSTVLEEGDFENQTLRLPNDVCQHNSPNLHLCRISVRAPKHGLFIKMEVLGLNFDHPNTADCRYGGLKVNSMLSPRQYQPVKRFLLLTVHDVSLIWDPPIALCYYMFLGNRPMELPFSTLNSRTQTMHVTYYRYHGVGRADTPGQVKLLFTTTRCQGLQVYCGPMHTGISLSDQGKSFTDLTSDRATNPVRINPKDIGSMAVVANSKLIHSQLGVVINLCGFKGSMETFHRPYGCHCGRKYADMYSIVDVSVTQIVWYKCEGHAIHSIAPSTDTPCVSVQQTGAIPHWYAHPGVPGCDLYLPLLQASTIWTANCTNRIDTTIPGCHNRHSFDFMRYSFVSDAYHLPMLFDVTYRPTCGFYRADIELSSAPLQLDFTDITRFGGNIPVSFQMRSGSFLLESLHHDLQVVYPSDGLSTTVISHYDTSLYMLLAHIAPQFTDFRGLGKLSGPVLYSHHYRNQLRFTAKGSVSVCHTLCVNVTVAVSNRGPVFAFLHHVKTLSLKLHRGQRMTYHDPMIVEQRHIFINPTNQCRQKSSCSLHIDIDPLQPAVLPLLGFTHPKQHTRNSIHGSATHFILIANHFTSWNEAEDVCRSFGAHLATATTEDERVLLVNLLLGLTFNRESTTLFRSNCRLREPLCVTFLGLRGSMVGKIAISQLYSPTK